MRIFNFLRSVVQKIGAIIREYPWLAALILTGFAIRLWGIGIGLPTTDLVGDETTSIQYILRILATGNPFIHKVNPYPIMMSVLGAPFVLMHLAVMWIQNGFSNATQLQTHLVLTGVNALQIWPRLVSAIFGTATLFVAFRILSKLFARPAAYLGTAAITVSLLAVHLSHWGRSHSVMTFFIMATAYAAILCVLENQKKYYYATFALAGCALATHYLGVASFIFPFLLFWFYKPSFKEFLNAAGILLAVAVPAYLINFSGTLLMVWGAFYNYYIPNNFSSLLPVGKYERFYYVLRDLLYLDPVGVVVGALGFILLIVRKKFSKPMLVLLIGTAFMFLIQISIVAAPRESRWLLPFNMFFLSVGFAALADYVYEKLGARRVLTYVLMVLVIPELIVSLKWLSMLNDHTQLQVERWMREHRTDRMFIYSENINPTPTPEAAAWNAEKSPRLKTSAKNLYVIAHPEQFAGNGISYFHGTEFGDADRCVIFKELRIKYVIIKYISKEERVSVLEDIEKCTSSEPVTKFYPGSDALLSMTYENLVNSILTYRYVLASTTIGPWFEIYEVTI